MTAKSAAEINNYIHDIRNPLNSISMNAELGKLCLEAGGEQDKILQALDNILKQCSLCAAQLNEFGSYLTDQAED